MSAHLDPQCQNLKDNDFVLIQ